MKHYVAYLRVSTGKQRRSGLGLEAQRSIINHYARGDVIVMEYIETESARNIEDRPLLKEAVEYCQQNDCVLIVAKLDRLSRDVSDTFHLLKELKSRLVICEIPYDAIDSFTLAIFAGLAQREREIISLRTKAALAEKKKQGIKLGSPGNLQKGIGAVAALQKVRDFYNRRILIALIEKLVRDAYTLERMAIDLNQEGFRTFRGKLYNKVSVHRLLKNIQKYTNINIAY